MIIDKLDNTTLYKGLSHNIKKALNFLETTNFEILEKGKHLIDGDNLFVLINEYETKDDTVGHLEAHRNYIDVQFMIEGEEKIGVRTLIGQHPIKEYDSSDDYILFDEKYDTITLKKGMFAVFFPDDLHKPCIKINKPMKVRKAVVKVKFIAAG